MVSIAIILANGILEDAPRIRDRVRQLKEFRVFAADGGSHHAENLGLTVEKVIGDLDSLGEMTREKLAQAGVSFDTHPAMKDETDLELTLLYVQKLGFSRVILLGALGGRVDMMLTNIQLLAHSAFQDLKLEIWHGSQTAWVQRPPGAELPGIVGDTISLIPLAGPAEGITTEHLLYPLHSETLFPGPGRGISNVIEQTNAHLTLSAGMLLVVHTPQSG
jgi:thiamine pyrophosphokinase